MCKFTEIRLRRIEADIIKDIQVLNNNLDTVIRCFEYNAIPAKLAYKRAQKLATRFDMLLNRLQNALNAANTIDKYNDPINFERFYIEHKDYKKTLNSMFEKLEFFGL